MVTVSSFVSVNISLLRLIIFYNIYAIFLWIEVINVISDDAYRTCDVCDLCWWTMHANVIHFINY